jgi:cell surface protein SprA
VSNRLASQNPYWTQSPAYTTDGYAKGYGRYSQDVLIPAFLAAYTGKSPYTIALVKESSSNIKSNPFGGYLPKPNWRLSYSGLNRIPALAKIFSAINITNAYSGILSMNSYTSSLTYSDVSKYGSPGFIDTVSGNYVPFYVVPNVSIQEQFSPLIGVEATTVKQWSFKFVYNKSRQLSLSLVDYQMSETNSKEWIFGFGWRKRGIRLPFKIPGMQGKKLQNDLSLKLDISLRDDATGNSTLDQTTAYATSGQKVFSLQPSVDYVLNNRINLKLYFTRLKTTPYISTTAPTVSTTAGLQVRISLAP